MRQIQVTVPRKKVQNVISALRNKCRVQNIVRLAAGDDNLIILRVDDEEVRNTVKNLQELGIGTQMGCLDIIHLEESSLSKESSDQKMTPPSPSEIQKTWWEKIFIDSNINL